MKARFLSSNKILAINERVKVVILTFRNNRKKALSFFIRENEREFIS